jgi:hypothetical protein
MVRQTTRITVETETLTVFRRAKAGVSWCPECRAEVDVITLTDDSFSEPATAAQVEAWLRTGNLHFWRFASGPAQICVPSLLQCFESEKPRRFSPANEGPLDESRRR